MKVDDKTLFEFMSKVTTDLATLVESHKNLNNFFLGVKKEAGLATAAIQSHLVDQNAHGTGTSEKVSNGYWMRIAVLLNVLMLGATCLLAYRTH